MMIDRTGNLADIKGKILSFMKIRGPSLPIHISKETKTTLLLASAFLSDMASEKTIKISNMKVGGSPLYYLHGQEAMLENFEKFLNGKEREALALLKQSLILKDDELEPSIRVALRSLKDFAKPYTIKLDDKTMVFWQHFSLGEEEANKLISNTLEQIQEKLKPAKEEIKIEQEAKTGIEPKPIAEEKKEEKEEKAIEPIFKEKSKPKPRAKREKPQPDKFLNEIKAILNSKNLELINIEKYDKKEVIARIKSGNSECLLFAFNKKRADESDLLKAHKRASLVKMPYHIICREEPSKRLKETIEAYKNLAKIDKIDKIDTIENQKVVE